MTTTRPRAGDDLRDVLTRLERAREHQLAALPETTDPVAAAHRASVERILEDIRVARRQLDANAYGTCTTCGGRIDEERLARHLWATKCTACADRVG